MIPRKLQFAVVREDPEIELAVLERYPARRALVIGSGGCTVFTLRSKQPGLELLVVEPNRAQVEWIEAKSEALRTLPLAERLRAFDVGAEATDDHPGWTQRGNFEGLFRGLRRFLNEFVASAAEFHAFFDDPNPLQAQVWFANRYWKVAFEMFFSDALLEAMFSRAATQHAAPGSYPDYFRRAFERGLIRPDADVNYFLHHVFLGHYRDDSRALPPYLISSVLDSHFEICAKRIEEVEDFSAFEFIHLSNVMDWMDESSIARLTSAIRNTTKHGTTLLWRQLNNDRDLAAGFGPAFSTDPEFERSLLSRDRSLFYCHIGVARRIA